MAESDASVDHVLTEPKRPHLIDLVLDRPTPDFCFKSTTFPQARTLLRLITAS